MQFRNWHTIWQLAECATQFRNWANCQKVQNKYMHCRFIKNLKATYFSSEALRIACFILRERFKYHILLLKEILIFIISMQQELVKLVEWNLNISGMWHLWWSGMHNHAGVLKSLLLKRNQEVCQKLTSMHYRIATGKMVENQNSYW